MNKWKKLGIQILISWVISFVALVLVSSWYLPVEVNTSLTVAFALFALIISLFVILYLHKVAHAGHLFLVIGLLVLIYTIGMIYGAFSFGEKEKLWTLSDIEIAVYTFLGIVGLISFLDGIKQMWQSRYFVGRGRGR